MKLRKNIKYYLPLIILSIMVLFLSACQYEAEDWGNILSFELLDEEDNNIQKDVIINSEDMQVVSYVGQETVIEGKNLKPIITVPDGFEIYHEDSIHDNNTSSYNFENPVEFTIVKASEIQKTWNWTITVIKEPVPENMVFVEAGTTSADNGELTLDYNLYVSKFLVTFDDYDEYVNITGVNSPADEGWGREDRPVINVNWIEVIEYANWLSEQEGLTPAYDDDQELIDDPGLVEGYRLPTNHEWEYIYKGGKDGLPTTYSGSNDAFEVAWVRDNPNADPSHYGDDDLLNRTQPVGQLQPNELGIYDMGGNVVKWTNTPNPDDESQIIGRGGAWTSSAWWLGEFDKIHTPGKGYNNNQYGFRLIRTKVD